MRYQIDHYEIKYSDLNGCLLCYRLSLKDALKRAIELKNRGYVVSIYQIRKVVN